MTEFPNIQKISVKKYFDAILSEKKPENWREIEREKEQLLKEKPPTGYIEAYQKLLLAEGKMFLKQIKKLPANPLDELDLKSAQRQLEQITKKLQPNTRASLEKWANAVGRFLGHRIDKKKTTAFELLVATQQLNEHIASENKASKQQRNVGKH